MFGLRRLRAWRDGTAPVPAAASSDRIGYRPQNSRFASSPRAGQTIASLLQLEAAPTSIRLLFVNDQPQPWRVDGAMVATSAAVGDGLTPVGTDGRPDPDLWRRVPCGTGGAAACDVPGNPREPGRPVHLWSDWVDVDGLGRRDGGRGHLVLVRTFSRGLQRFAASTGAPDRAMRRAHAGFAADGEALGPGAPAGFARDDTLFACHGVQFVARRPGASVLGVGDSIIHSSCTTGEMSGYAARACAMISSARRPVSYVNEGFPGRNSTGFCANGLWAVEAFRPQAAVIQAWSRNEAWTAEAATEAFARAMAVAEAVRRHGGAPILATAAPSFPHHPDAEPARQAGNERVRALGRAGWPVIDVDAIWGTGGVPNTYRRAFDAGDGLHPNDRASVVAARVLAPLLDRVIA